MFILWYRQEYFIDIGTFFYFYFLLFFFFFFIISYGTQTIIAIKNEHTWREKRDFKTRAKVYRYYLSQIEQIDRKIPSVESFPVTNYLLYLDAGSDQ